MPYTTLGCHYTWWRGDPLTELPVPAGFRAERVEAAPLLARLCGCDLHALQARIDDGNRPYIATLESTPVAYGWSAARFGRIEELNAEWPLSPLDRYLFDFATLPAWRGRGVYPRLLQAILIQESAEAERFWIGHAVDNRASRVGILKAGFLPERLIVRTDEGQLKWVAQGNLERALADPIGHVFGPHRLLAVISESSA